jgi:hypothetical protein
MSSKGGETMKKSKTVKSSKPEKLRYSKTMSPYMRVEYIHGKEHEVVEFDGDGQLRGCAWEDTSKHNCHSFSWFISGFACALAIWAVVVTL